MRICIIDYDEFNSDVLRTLITQRTELVVECYSTGLEAMKRLENVQFDMVAIDSMMAETNGRISIAGIRALAGYDQVPIVVMEEQINRPFRLEAMRAGANEFMRKPIDIEEMWVRGRNLLHLRAAQLKLERYALKVKGQLAEATQKVAAREEELIWRMSRAIGSRDGTTGLHISRVAGVAQMLAEGLGMSREWCRRLYLATPLHDAGKIGVSDLILNKPGALNATERAQIEAHTDIGAEILEGSDIELLQMAHEIALSHHERWDGTGYGQGLAGEDIPLSGRIVAVADVLDALCSTRPYKDAWPFADACAEIMRGAGTHFDPQCVAVFQQIAGRISQIYALEEGDEPEMEAVLPEMRYAGSGHGWGW